MPTVRNVAYLLWILLGLWAPGRLFARWLQCRGPLLTQISVDSIANHTGSVEESRGIHILRPRAKTVVRIEVSHRVKTPVFAQRIETRVTFEARRACFN